MKTFFTLGALAALCQSAYSLNPGPYIIASANSDSQILTDENLNQPLTFTQPTENENQVWQFNAVDGGYFEIQSVQGSFIDCHRTEDRTCYSSERPRAFIPEFQGDNKYELVEEGSGLFLRIAKEGGLQLAEWDQSLNEQFTLTPVN